jgi:predicted dehydrogenase
MNLTRRHILAAPFFVRHLFSAPPNSTLRLASFGAGGMAYETLHGIARHKSVKVACVADVDATKFAQVDKVHPGAVHYADWREMLRKERKNIDIVCVGTPDHMHAPQAMAAMRLGFPVYIQKPLAHDIYEVRKLTEYATKKKLITQMGIQIHSTTEYKAAVQWIQSGVIGKVKEVHAWSNKKWGDTEALPTREDAVPEGLNWDHWLGIAPKRPFLKDVYHPANWRKRIDFGTATFGDMGCHIYDPVFAALALTAPVSVRSEGPSPANGNWALNSIIKYVFPATRFTEGKTVNVTWYDGDMRPPQEVLSLLGTRRVPGQGSIMIGTDGVMLLPHIGMPVLLPEEKFKGRDLPKQEPANHYFQFVDAVLGKGQTSTQVSYSGPLTEAVLLGPLATRFPQTTLEWNSGKLKFNNSKEANRYIRRRYRKGWEVKGL